MQLEIRGHHLPGRTWSVDGEARDHVHVGLEVGRAPHGLVSGAADSAAWTTDVTVVATGDGPDFRGPAVQGRRGERFLCLTWGHVDADGAFHLFRRAKLMCEDLAPLVVDDPDRSLVATVDLTDESGGPRCARLRPPALEITAV